MVTGRFLISLDVFVETQTCDGARGTRLNLTHGLFSLFSAFKFCAAGICECLHIQEIITQWHHVTTHRLGFRVSLGMYQAVLEMVWIFARSRECCEMVSTLSSQCDSSPRHSVSGLMMSGTWPGSSSYQTFRIGRQNPSDAKRMRDFDGVTMWPGVRCLQRLKSAWRCVTVVTWRRDTEAQTGRHCDKTRDTLSALSRTRILPLLSVTNLVKKAEATRGRGSVGIVTIYQHHSCPLALTPHCPSLLSNLSI